MVGAVMAAFLIGLTMFGAGYLFGRTDGGKATLKAIAMNKAANHSEDEKLLREIEARTGG